MPLSAKDIMVTKLVTVPPDMQVGDAMRLLVKSQISGAPIVDEAGNYLGVFSEKCCMRLFARIAEAAAQQQVALPTLMDARQLMSPKLVVLNPLADVVKAIGDLLKNHISGVPVVDADNRFLGVFSEKTSMSVLIQVAYEQLPSTTVGEFMNRDYGRTILEDASFLECARLFRETPYRRLPVLRGGQVIGQVSRRDLLANANELVGMIRSRAVIVRPTADDAACCEQPPDAPLEQVRHFGDVKAETITEDIDLLAIAQIFLRTPRRRLPVVRDGKLVGQVSRRDILETTHRLMELPARRESTLLYLSALDATFHH